jgi:hypothetical protein
MPSPRRRRALPQHTHGVLAVVASSRTDLVKEASLSRPIGPTVARLERCHQLVLVSLPHSHERYSPR